MLTGTFVDDEIVRTGMALFPYIAVGFTLMCAFSLATVFISTFYFWQQVLNNFSDDYDFFALFADSDKFVIIYNFETNI